MVTNYKQIYMLIANKCYIYRQFGHAMPKAMIAGAEHIIIHRLYMHANQYTHHQATRKEEIKKEQKGRKKGET